MVTLTYEFGTGTQLDKPFLTQLQIDLDELATAVTANEAAIASLVSSFTAAVNSLSINFITDIIKQPQNQNYRIVTQLPYGVTLNLLAAQTASGTCTMVMTINGTPVTGGTINANSSLQVATMTAANVCTGGEQLIMVVSSVSNAVDLSWTMTFTRTIP